ncbi:MAG: aldo/keto reductase [Kordiimonas sp.]
MRISRREFNRTVTGCYIAAQLTIPIAASDQLAHIKKKIPSSSEAIPITGLGSWITFNIGRDQKAQQSVESVMRAFFAEGGMMIDSSPMYGSSQSVIGKALSKIGTKKNLFSADKVWTNGRDNGVAQIEETSARWGVTQFDLLQVHNLRDWEKHLHTLFAMKAEGRLKYVGITTSHGRRHRELASIMESHPLDFVQLTYNMSNREAERRVLPLAKERGIAVIANRPFDGGRLIRRLKRESFPDWARHDGLSGWADFVLKFNASHEAVTCSIPATTRVDHVRENMSSCRGHLPDETTRRRMLQYVENL